jgi:hypothetical protein
MVRSYGDAIVGGLRDLGCGARATITQTTIAAVADEVEALFVMAREGSFPSEANAERLDVSDARQSEVLGEDFMRRVLDLQNLVAQAVEAFSQAVGELQRTNDAARRKAKGVADKEAQLDETEDVSGMFLLARHYAIDSLDSHRGCFEQACQPLVNHLIAVRLNALAKHMQSL